MFSTPDQFYPISRNNRLSIADIPTFYEACGNHGMQTVELPPTRLIEKLTTLERATATIAFLDNESPAPTNQVGEALVRLRGWQRDRGLHLYSVNRLARHLTQAQGTSRHPASWRLAKHGWSLLAALDAAELVRIELTAEDSRERMRLARRLAELEGRVLLDKRSRPDL